MSGVPYTDLSNSGHDLFLGAGLSLIISAVLLAVTTSLLGWWRPAVFDRSRARHRQPIIAPILMGVAVAVSLTSTDWASYDGAFFGASIALLLVGFTEELTTRGLLLTGLRARLSETWVWFITSALFALMHLLNSVSGQALATTMQQVGLAFGAGTIFYVVRRVTGSLVWAMILHGLWDSSTFGLGHGNPGPFYAYGAAIQAVTIVLGLVGVAFVIRGADERLG